MDVFSGRERRWMDEDGYGFPFLYFQRLDVAIIAGAWNIQSGGR